MKIENRSIGLKNFNLSNITQKYISWLNDKSLLKYSRHKNKNFNYKKAIDYYYYQKKKKNLFLSIFLKKYKKNIGTLTLVYKKNKICNIGILIGDKKYHNKGLASNIINLLLKNSYFSTKVKFFEIGTKHGHKSMIKIAKNCKFKMSHKNKNYIYYRKKNNDYKLEIGILSK